MNECRGGSFISRGGVVDFYDISRNLQEGIAVWPGDPDLRVRWATRIRDGASCNVAAFSMGSHTGTHLDAPLHLDDSGGDAAGIPIRSCIGPVRVFSMPTGGCICAADLQALDWQGVERVLFKTRHSPPTDGFDRSFAYLSDDAAEYLIGLGIVLVGTDSPSIDAFDSPSLNAHRILLGHGVVILEGACMEEVPPGDFELICLPLKLAGLDGSPVRAVLLKR